MKNNQVCWAEGLFLKPHHLQQADLYWHELIGSQGRLDHPYNYGVHELEINHDSLTTWQLDVTTLKGRLKDGTYVSFEGRLDLTTADGAKSAADALNESGGHLIVYLAVAQLRTQSANVATQPDQLTRFVSSNQDRFDFCSGENSQPVEFQSMNYRLMLSTQETTGYECIPICRLVLSSKGERSPMVDPTFIPPMLSTNGASQLRNTISRMNDLISSHIEQWTNEIRNRGISYSAYSPEDLRSLTFATMLGEIKAWFSCQINSTGSHPFQFYQMLASWLGKLAVLNPVDGQFILNVARYDHENLGNVFGWLTTELERRLFVPAESNVKQVFFRGNNGIMKASVEHEWLASKKWRLYFGINLREMPGADRVHFLNEIFLKANRDKLYWKMGSEEKISEYFQGVARGVVPNKYEKTKPGLSKRPIWLFAEFEKDRFWEEVKQSYTLSFRVDQDRIHNINELEGNESIVVSVDHKLFKFQIAVFAVKN